MRGVVADAQRVELDALLLFPLVEEGFGVVVVDGRHAGPRRRVVARRKGADVTQGPVQKELRARSKEGVSATRRGDAPTLAIFPSFWKKSRHILLEREKKTTRTRAFVVVVVEGKHRQRRRRCLAL